MSNAQLARLLPTGISRLVSLVSLRMALKGLSAKAWRPFHQAAEVDWNSLPLRLRLLLLFMVRMAGLGFLALFLLLATIPVYVAWHPDPFVGLTIFSIATTHCVGLGIVTRWLHRETGAGTPWKESFAAAGFLVHASVLYVSTR